MRKVLFKRFIPLVYEDVVNNVRKRKEGTGIWQTEFINKGLFHCWGVESDDRDTGVNTNTIALVELSNGEIEQVYPFNIKFITPLFNEYEVALAPNYPVVIDIKK